MAVVDIHVLYEDNITWVSDKELHFAYQESMCFTLNNATLSK